MRDWNAYAEHWQQNNEAIEIKAAEQPSDKREYLRFLGDEWKQLSVRAEANWLRADEWQVGYDAVLLDSVTTQLEARIGRRP